MRECVKNWEDTTPGTGGARWLSIPADGSYGLSLHSDRPIIVVRNEGFIRVEHVERVDGFRQD